ncbi:periplasmic binding protein-like I [Catenaria anguillulae PL171]|uniref:Periplasmic binding protein-like I n=1 Tax=Catenaria anguillulae PL171 TaxID=765915 RepID=A0A1Y2HX99_9FUNG|nr:periplasmic binding protein-like I [Catenaria anguillulae PL171]
MPASAIQSPHALPHRPDPDLNEDIKTIQYNSLMELNALTSLVLKVNASISIHGLLRRKATSAGSTAWLDVAFCVSRMGFLLHMSHVPLTLPITNLLRQFQQDPTILDSIDSRYRFELIFTPSGTTASASVGVAMASVIERNVSAIVGEFTSTNALATGMALGSYFKTPMCSGSAGSGDLSDKNNYPLTFRTLPESTWFGVTFAVFIQQMGWRNAVAFYSNDALGQSLAAAFRIAGRAKNLNILFVPFDPAATDLTPQFSQIANSYIRVIVFLTTVDVGQPVLIQAKDYGLVGPDFVWMGTMSFNIIVSRNSDPALRARASAASNGLFFIDRSIQSTPAMIQMESSWAQQYPNTSIALYSHEFYDCTLALARGLVRLANQVGYNNVITRNYSLSGVLPLFLQPFDGASGRVEFDANGNRFRMAGLVNNIVDGVITPAYRVLPNETLEALQGPKFFANDGKVPRDKPLQMAMFLTWSEVGPQLYAAFMAVILLAFVGSAIYVAKHRKKPAIKSLSWTFLLFMDIGCILMLIGVFLGLGQPTNATCMAQVTGWTLGGGIVLSSCTAKAFRIYRVYDNTLLSKSWGFKDRELAQAVSAVLIVESILLAVALGLVPINAVEVSTPLTISYRCKLPTNSSIGGFIAGFTLLGFLVLLLFSVLFFAYRTRHIKSVYGESSWLLYMSQNMTVIGGAMVPFLMFDFGQQQRMADWVVIILQTYVMLFTYWSVVGRIVLMAHFEAPYNPSMQNLKGDGTTAAGSPSGIKTFAIGTKPASTSNENPQTRHAVGIFPVKKCGSILATWVKHRVTLCARNGYMTITPDAEKAKRGSIHEVIPLQPSSFKPTVPEHPLVIQILAPLPSSSSWFIQFPDQETYDTWCIYVSETSGSMSSLPTTSEGGGSAGGGGSTADASNVVRSTSVIRKGSRLG